MSVHGETTHNDKNDWVVHFSKTWNRHYFFNEKTGKSVWNKPIEIKKESPSRYISPFNSAPPQKPLYIRPLRKKKQKALDLDTKNKYKATLVGSHSSLTEDVESRIERQIEHTLHQTNEYQTALSNSRSSLIEEEERQIQKAILLTGKHTAFSQRFEQMENETNTKKRKRLIEDFQKEAQVMYYGYETKPIFLL